MFYMLANVHHQITIGEVLPLPNRFWYYLLDLPFGIQNTMLSLQLELEYLISREAPRSTILFGVTGTDVPLFHTFLEILSGKGPEYDSDNINYNDPPCMCYHINGEVQSEEEPGPTPSDQSPRSCAAYLQEKTDCLRSR
jgi:hypothetical protein